MYKLVLFAISAAIFISLQASAQSSIKVINVADSVHVRNNIPVKYAGKALECYEYQDKKGRHLFLVTSTNIKKNFLGNCYIKVGHKWRPEWKIKDEVHYDWVITDEHTKIVDINHDGILENIFIYSVISEKGNRVYSVRSWLHFKNQNCDFSIYQGEFDNDAPIKSMGGGCFLDIPKYAENYVTKLLDASLKQLMKK